MVLAWALLAALAAGCKGGLDETACTDLRGQAFEVINKAHTCNSDADCRGTDWPGCSKPINGKHFAKVAVFKGKFVKGQCTEGKESCRDAPEIYCKQGLCVFRELAGGAPNPKK